jgi:hypothetical protein
LDSVEGRCFFRYEIDYISTENTRCCARVLERYDHEAWRIKSPRGFQSAVAQAGELFAILGRMRAGWQSLGGEVLALIVRSSDFY